MSDDTPTQRFDQQPSPTPSGSAPNGREKRGPLIPILIAVGAVLVVAVVVLAIVLFNRGTTGTLALSTNTPTDTPSATNSAGNTPVVTPSPTTSTTHTTAPPPPANTNLQITSYLVDGSTHPVIACDQSAPMGPVVIHLTFQWTALNATNVYWGVSTTDAQSGGSFRNLPEDGSNADFPSGNTDQTFPCPAASQEYTLTVVNDHGGKLSKYITVTNDGDH